MQTAAIPHSLDQPRLNALVWVRHRQRLPEGGIDDEASGITMLLQDGFQHTEIVINIINIPCSTFRYLNSQNTIPNKCIGNILTQLLWQSMLLQNLIQLMHLQSWLSINKHVKCVLHIWCHAPYLQTYVLDQTQ
jgi:hypothetical protein